MNAVPYELWDVETGNCLGVYPDEGSALAEVRAGLRANGAAAWASVGPLRRGAGAEETTAIAEGNALITRAQEAREMVMVGGVAFDAERLTQAAATVRMLDAIKGVDLDEALRNARAALAALHERSGDLRARLESVQAAAAFLTRNAGVTVQFETDGRRIALLTPDERMAGFLATQISRTPGPVQLGVIENLYRIELVLTEGGDTEGEDSERIAG